MSWKRSCERPCLRSCEPGPESGGSLLAQPGTALNRRKLEQGRACALNRLEHNPCRGHRLVSDLGPISWAAWRLFAIWFCILHLSEFYKYTVLVFALEKFIYTEHMNSEIEKTEEKWRKHMYVHTNMGVCQYTVIL